jgi:hypothetical protein
MVIVTVLTILILTISSHQQRGVFAMHDSTLDVNTWIASDNSTQLHTIDLNNAPVSSTSTEEAGETEEGDITEEQEVDEEPSSDEDEDEGEEEEQD